MRDFSCCDGDAVYACLRGKILEKSVPWFYYRLNTDGTRYTTNTGYDNEFSTERKMYRNYMVNSMKYWAEEYHVDGFSLDLIDCVNVKVQRFFVCI